MSAARTPIRVGVFGAGGRMGATVCDAVAGDPELELVAAVDPRAVGSIVHGIEIGHDPRVLADAGAQVAVDFTVADAARTNLQWCALHGLHAVVGTTGLGDADLDALRAAFTRSGCVVAANFAISAVLMMRFAELAAPLFDTAEIIELHHDAKVDAPSGTAMVTARRMSEARRGAHWAPDPTRHAVVDGARGGDVDGIRVHSVRMRGMVAHQEVLLGAAGQTISIRQDSYDRVSFAPGVVRAVKWVVDHPGLTLGLEPVLGL
jgi:4-hydroxy-tetrahydrodipicolinate reductase